MTVGLLALLVTHSSGGFIPSVARSTAARYIAQFTMSTVHLYKKEEEKINKLEGNESTTSMFITQENEKRPYQSKLFTTSFLSSSFFFQIFFLFYQKGFYGFRPSSCFTYGGPNSSVIPLFDKRG